MSIIIQHESVTEPKSGQPEVMGNTFLQDLTTAGIEYKLFLSLLVALYLYGRWVLSFEPPNIRGSQACILHDFATALRGKNKMGNPLNVPEFQMEGEDKI